MDFQDNRRKEIFGYLFERYGEKNVCQIGTVGRMKGKMAVLDVGRVFKVPVSETYIVNKHIIERSSGDARSNQTVEDSFNEFDVCKDYDKKYPDVLKHVIKLEGKARQVGIHAAGIQIAPTDISKIIPIEYRESSGERVKVSSLDWMECQGLGLVKIDVLGLKTLTILKTAVDKIYERHDAKIDLEKLKFDDVKVLDGFTNTNFIGIFQFDSVGMTMICRELDFTHFNDIMVMNALYRPSGMRSGWAKKYIPRKLGRDKIPKVHPIYDRITAETNGILLYQEQLIRTFVELAGYDPGTGDELRKKIAKSYGVETISKEKEKFIEGAVKNGMDAPSAKKLLEEMAFAGSYAFNKSHSAAYSAIAYWGMFLKIYYPVEFFYSLMYHEDDKQEIMRFVTESRRVGIDVKMPDINKSDAGFAIGDNDEIRCGLIDIKGVGEKATAQIIGNQPFSSIRDMCEKVNRTAVNRGVIRSLIMSNAFKEMYSNTGALLAVHELVGMNGKKKKEMPVWEWMLDMGENDANHLYRIYDQSLEPDYMMDEEHEVVMMSTVCPIPPPKHKIEYYKNVVKHLDKNFEIYGCTTLDWSKARVRLKGVLVEIKYNNVGDFHKEEPSDKIKRRIRWGSRYATFNIEDETGIKRSSVDIDTFPTFRRIIDKGLGTPILISGSTFQPNELVQSDVVVDMDEIREILETDGTLVEKFMKMDKFQRYFLRHPIKPYRKKYPTYATCKTIMSKKSGSFRYIGLVVRIKYHWTRGKDKKMAFINVEDETDNLSLVVWSDSLAKYKDILQLGNIIRCVVKRDKDSCFIDGTVKKVKTYFDFV
jgi:DNA-directed DNA polymerase III PolC